nr:hypothetical protein [Elainella sp. Prado103]
RAQILGCSLWRISGISEETDFGVEWKMFDCVLFVLLSRSIYQDRFIKIDLSRSIDWKQVHGESGGASREQLSY